MLFNITAPSAKHGHPDCVAVLLLIDELFATKPNLFGNQATQQAFANDCAATLTNLKQKKEFFYLSDMLNLLPTLFAKHHITPLNEIDAISVAPDKNQLCIGRDSEQPLLPILELFRKFHIIPQNEQLYQSSANTLANGMKADFVITGNVINFASARHRENIMRACGMMLKQGGTAIHMLSYGELEPYGPNIAAYDTFIIDNHETHRRCEQTHLRNIPEGKYDDQGATYAMVLRQENEIPYEISSGIETATTPPYSAKDITHGGIVDRTLREKE